MRTFVKVCRWRRVALVSSGVNVRLSLLQVACILFARTPP